MTHCRYINRYNKISVIINNIQITDILGTIIIFCKIKYFWKCRQLNNYIISYFTNCTKLIPEINEVSNIK